MSISSPKMLAEVKNCLANNCPNGDVILERGVFEYENPLLIKRTPTEEFAQNIQDALSQYKRETGVAYDGR